MGSKINSGWDLFKASVISRKLMLHSIPVGELGDSDLESNMAVRLIPPSDKDVNGDLYLSQPGRT